MNNTIDSHELDKRVLNSQVEELFTPLPVSLIVTVINALLLYFIQYDLSDQATASYWLVTTLAVVALRASLYFLYKFPKQDYLVRDNKVWIRIFFITTVAAGAVWSAAGVALFPDNKIEQQIFLIFVIAGMASGSVATLCADKVTAWVFLALLILPVIIQLSSGHSNTAFVMSLMMTLALMSALIISHNNNRRLIDNIRASVESRYRESELIKLSSGMAQTQKLAELVGWELNLESREVTFIPDCLSGFEELNDKKQQIASTITHAALQSSSFTSNITLRSELHKTPQTYHIVGEQKANNATLFFGSLQNITSIVGNIGSLSISSTRYSEKFDPDTTGDKPSYSATKAILE